MYRPRNRTGVNRSNTRSNMSPIQIRAVLIRQAAQAAQALDVQLNKLLDAYDFAVQRFEGDNELLDLNVSLEAAGTLPLCVAGQLTQWAKNETPDMSRDVFDMAVLTELSLHLFAILNFMDRRNIDAGVTDESMFDSLNSLRLANSILTP